MTTFTGQGFVIYSGTKGDVIVRPDGIWVETGAGTIQWTGFLQSALDRIGFQR